MKQAKYDALVKEGRSLWRNTRQTQVRLMVILKVCEDDGCLDQYCEDIDISPPAAKNYLAAHAAFLDLGFVPGSGDGVDQTIVKMWTTVFDATLDGRFGYGSVDREGVDAAADELGLKGNTKAYDIAKNPNSMKAAIIGDGRAASAAVDALVTRAHDDPLIATALRTALRERPPRPPHPRERDDYQMVQDILGTIDHYSIRLTEFDVPENMAIFVINHINTVIDRLRTVITIMEGKEALADL